MTNVVVTTSCQKSEVNNNSFLSTAFSMTAQEIRTLTSYVSNRLVSLGFLDLDTSFELSSHLLHDISKKQASTSAGDPLRPNVNSTPRNRSGKTSTLLVLENVKSTAESNDIKVLNILSSLLSSIESDNQTRDSLLLRVQAAQKEQEQLTDALKHMEAKSEGLQRQLDSVYKLNGYVQRGKSYFRPLDEK